MDFVFDGLKCVLLILCAEYINVLLGDGEAGI
jgi:hypothetical protein